MPSTSPRQPAVAPARHTGGVPGHARTPDPLRIGIVVCAYNEAGCIAHCLQTLVAQTRPADEIVVVDNASTDDTAAIAAAVPGVRVVAEPRKGLVVARDAGRRATTADLLLYLDADCLAPPDWVRRVERCFRHRPALIALSGTYRFHDWHLPGRALIRAYDFTVAPATHLFVKYVLHKGVVFYGGNFAVRRDALDAIGGFDTRIEFHGEDTNLGRRLAAAGEVALRDDCYVHTSARRYRAMGTWAVVGLYVRNFWSEILRQRPADITHQDVRDAVESHNLRGRRLAAMPASRPAVTLDATPRPGARRGTPDAVVSIDARPEAPPEDRS